MRYSAQLRQQFITVIPKLIKKKKKKRNLRNLNVERNFTIMSETTIEAKMFR